MVEEGNKGHYWLRKIKRSEVMELKEKTRQKKLSSKVDDK